MEIRGPKNHVGSEWDDWDDATESEEAFVLVDHQHAPPEPNADFEVDNDDADGFVLTASNEASSKSEGGPPSGTSIINQEESSAIEESSLKINHNNGEDDSPPVENKGFEFHFQVVGTLLFVLILVIGEIFHSFHSMHDAPGNLESSQYAGPEGPNIEFPSLTELLQMMDELEQGNKPPPTQVPSSAVSIDREDFETLKALAAPPPDIKPLSYRIEEVMPIPVPAKSSGFSAEYAGAPLLLPARPSPLMLGSQVAHQSVEYGAGEWINARRPIVSTSSSGPIPSKGYILADLEASPKAPLPAVHQEPQIPARALIPFATPRSPQLASSSQDAPMREVRVEGPTFNDTTVSPSLNNSISTSASSVLVKATGPTVFVGHKIESREDYKAVLKVYERVFVMFTKGQTIDPVWSALAVRVLQEKPSVKVAAVDCSALPGLCRELRISVFPTTYLFGNNRRETVSIKNGLASVDILMRFLERNHASSSIEPPAPPPKLIKKETPDKALTPKNFDNYVQKHNRVFVAFYHPKNPDEESFTPMWNDFTLDVKSQKLPLKPAHVDCTLYSDFCTNQGIRHFPSLRWFDHGKPVYPDNADKRTFKHLIMFARSMLRQCSDNAEQVKASSTALSVSANGDDGKAVTEVDTPGSTKKPRRSRKQHVPAKPRRAGASREEEKSSAGDEL